MDIKTQIKQKALELGFDLAGVASAEPIKETERRYFTDWLEGGNAAGMEYLTRNIDKRFNPSLLLEGAKSVICVALSYKPAETAHNGPCKVADYALYEDYHEFIKARLRKLVDFIVQTIEEPVECKTCVDSVPLAERSYARRAGLGFIGRNHCLIHPELGAQLLLGEIITTLELPADVPMDKDYCGSCNRCIESCPTGALVHNGEYDCRKCISYLTIEEKGDILEMYYKAIGIRLFGCDNCLLACPYQTAAPARKNLDFQYYPLRNSLVPQEILTWTNDDFLHLFKNSPVHRLGLESLKRNAEICQKNQCF
ncbi:MAG: tRNA epoxyqueuosine(34) reductase QueG [Sedimentisphaerales bacterium]|nr:tRNA epoxyqueuosine(34) reductase QueG [Sedimentisphaerales bacterium]